MGFETAAAVAAIASIGNSVYQGKQQKKEQRRMQAQAQEAAKRNVTVQAQQAAVAKEEDAQEVADVNA